MKPLVVVFGVSGCGKSTIGRTLATKLQVPFHDADDFHPTNNITKMRKGIPLSDQDRAPWLYLLSELLAREASNNGMVLACSALKESYRKILCQIVTPQFVLLDISFDEAAKRLSKRRHHFMPLSLLQSQFDTLEIPDESFSVSTENTKEEMILKIISNLGYS